MSVVIDMLPITILTCFPNTLWKTELHVLTSGTSELWGWILNFLKGLLREQMLCCILHCPEPDQAVTVSGFNRSPAGNKYHTTPESRWGLSSAWAGKDLKNLLGADFKVWREGLITPNCFINIPKCEEEADKAQTLSLQAILLVSKYPRPLAATGPSGPIPASKMDPGIVQGPLSSEFSAKCLVHLQCGTSQAAF